MDKYEEMLKRADEKYHFSGLEKRKSISLLDYCHANDVRWTFRRMWSNVNKVDSKKRRNHVIINNASF